MNLGRIELLGQVKSMKKNFSENLSEKLSVPQETLGEVPLVQLHGKRTVCIENHRGILEYTDTLVKVSVKRGTIAVVGSRMEIARMTRRLLEIRGCIQRVELE